MDQLEKQKMLDHFDDLLKNSELSEEDVAGLDEKVKQGLHEKLSKMVK